MLCGITQKTEGLDAEIKSDGCLFLCFAYCSPLIFSGKEGVLALNILWKRAKKYMNSKLEIIDHTAVADLFCCEAEYDNQHHQANEKIPADVKFIFGRFVWKFGHFVVINRAKEVIYDPLVISYSVKNGTLETMRYYYAK